RTRDRPVVPVRLNGLLGSTGGSTNGRAVDTEYPSQGDHRAAECDGDQDSSEPRLLCGESEADGDGCHRCAEQNSYGNGRHERGMPAAAELRSSPCGTRGRIIWPHYVP